jgi:hypothetical protein
LSPKAAFRALQNSVVIELLGTFVIWDCEFGMTLEAISPLFWETEAEGSFESGESH